jgi:hypothetical protein
MVDLHSSYAIMISASQADINVDCLRISFCLQVEQDVVFVDMLLLHVETNKVATQQDTLIEEIPKLTMTIEAKDGG